MNTAVMLQEVKIKNVRVTDDSITAYLVDGRTISVPLAWSWRLSEATPQQRAHYEIIGDGRGIHWPEIYEDTLITRQSSHPRFARRLTSSLNRLEAGLASAEIRPH